MKIKAVDNSGRQVVKMKTTETAKGQVMAQWWLADNDMDTAEQLLSTVAYLKSEQEWRQRSVATFARLYGNQSLFGFMGQEGAKLGQSKNIWQDRPTFNLISSVTDTLVSRITQSRPAPVFLTDNSDYKERNLAKKLNNFILGEFYQTKAYEKAEYILRDALVTGTGCVKIYETEDHKVAIERVLQTELFVDTSEAMYDNPRQLYQIKLVDRSVLAASYPSDAKAIKLAPKATPDKSSDSDKSVADLVMVVEGWHLPSIPGAKDGQHTMAIVGAQGTLASEPWIKDCFPFVFLHHNKRLAGFWAQGTAEALTGTQMELNSLLWTISRSIKLVGIPRVFIEKGSKVVKSHINDQIGVIIEYSGIKPSYEVANCVPEEMYAERDRLINYGYKQEGVSEMNAQSTKPGGDLSGEALRTLDNVQTDRFAALSRRYDNFFIDLAYQIIDLAKDISIREGSYSTVYPNKNGVKEIDLPKATILDDAFVIQCFNTSSLPRDPAGRMQKITEMIQAGMVTIKEGRRLLDYPDLSQVETLANASEERIFNYLDQIVEDGTYNPPDPFMDLGLATQLVVQYINLYVPCKLEEDKANKLYQFFEQVQALIQAAVPPPPPQMPTAAPQAAPQPTPTSPLVPNGANQAPPQQ